MLRLVLFSLVLLFSTNCRGKPPNENARDMEGSEMMGDRGRMGDRGMMGGGMMDEGADANRWMMSDPDMMRDMGPEMMQDMRTIHQLLVNYEQIERRVEDLPNRIESWTESEAPQIAQAIQRHVHQMKERVEKGRAIRHMDPLFREIFRHHEKIDIQIENTPKGVHVIETSEDPQVVKLIQQHAHEAVSEFVEGGMQRAMQPTPLPEGYQP